jgi:hypothetical protein
LLTDIFKFDPKYFKLENEERYKSTIKAEILCEDSDEELGSDLDDSEEEEGKSIYLYRPLVIP